MSRARAAFEFPNFRYYMAARCLITAASEMQAVAVGWQIFGITHRPLDLGLVGLMQFLPGILLFLPAGHTADHVPRKRIITFTYLGLAICSALLLTLTLHGISTALPIFAVMVFNGIVRAFNQPASQSFLVLIVPQEHFQNAVSWASSMFQMSVIIGPSIGGFLYGMAGNPLPVYTTSMVFYLTAILLISRLRLPATNRPRGPVTLDTLLSGIRFIWHHPLILGAMSLDLFAVLLGGATALLPVYAHDILHVGAQGLGILRGAPAIGAVTMALVLAHSPPRQNAGIAMLSGVFGFGLAILVFGISRNFYLSIAALAASGAADMISVIVRHTLIQLDTPDEMRGRVSAVNGVFIGASNEVGQFESGLTAQWFGPVGSVMLGGMGTVLVVLAWARLFPGIRRFHQP